MIEEKLEAEVKRSIRNRVFWAQLDALIYEIEPVKATLNSHQLIKFNSISAKLKGLIGDASMVREQDPLHAQMREEFTKSHDALVKLLERTLLEDGGEEVPTFIKS